MKLSATERDGGMIQVLDTALPPFHRECFDVNRQVQYLNHISVKKDGYKDTCFIITNMFLQVQIELNRTEAEVANEASYD